MEKIEEKTRKTLITEIKWISIIIAFVASVLFNYFTVIKCVQLNTYRIEKIEEDRVERWTKYEACNTQQRELLEIISRDIEVIKTKLEIMEKKGL